MQTIKAKPLHKFHPAYNQVVYAVDSTNKNQTGFRYIFDFYSAGTTTLLASFDKVPPTGTNGYGVMYADEFLKDYVSFNKDTYTPTDCWINYDVKIGERYGSDWAYDDYEFHSSTGFTNGYVQLRQFASATTHSYIVGDQIEVTQDDPTIKPALEGLHTVIEVPNPYEIVIDVIFNDIGSGPTVGGDIVYADGRSVSYTGLTTVLNQVAFNGVIPFVQRVFTAQDYVMSGTNADVKFLTTCPSGIKMTETQDSWFNLITNSLTGTTGVNYIKIENSNGDIFRLNVNSYASTEPIIQIPVGPNNITATTATTGTLPIIKDSTTSYTFKACNSSGGVISETFRINLDRRCPINYNEGPFHLLYLDRLGSIGSMSVQLRMTENTQVVKDTYLSQQGYIDTTNTYWTYEVDGAGDTTLKSEESRIIKMNTNYMTEDEARYFDEVFASGVVWLYWDGAYQRVIVQDNGYETLRQRNKNLIRKEISIKFANSNIVNW